MSPNPPYAMSYTHITTPTRYAHQNHIYILSRPKKAQNLNAHLWQRPRHIHGKKLIEVEIL